MATRTKKREHYNIDVRALESVHDKFNLTRLGWKKPFFRRLFEHLCSRLTNKSARNIPCPNNLCQERLPQQTPLCRQPMGDSTERIVVER
jgi:hypothetical protein